MKARLDYIRASRGSHMPEIIFKIAAGQETSTCGRGVIVYCLGSKQRLHSNWKSQWTKECIPDDKRRSLSGQRENGFKEQRQRDEKIVQMLDEQTGAFTFPHGARGNQRRAGETWREMEKSEERGGDLKSRDEPRSDSESEGDFSDERRDHERRWRWRTGNNVL
ncbi:hypothetical protein TNCV_2161431 [Trichonephila clavipes]|nr:hypothetical protein TNCV_2161431 [Trichonephila clavipes]